MVPCICIKRLDFVLSIVDQPDSQMLIGQSDIISEIIDPGDDTDKFSTAGVVVTSLVQHDPAESDWQSLFGVALRHGH